MQKYLFPKTTHMKTLNSFFLLAFIILQINVFGQINSFSEQGMVNIATLKVDFDTYAFEGGNMAYYHCEDCNNDSIPLLIEYIEPGDFGGITFTLSPSIDTIFDATIIWGGDGTIQYPSFSNYTPIGENYTEKPNNIRLLYMDRMPIEQDYLLEKIDSVWAVVDSLDITS